VTVARTRRQALYFPVDTLAELKIEAKRQDRSISWLIQKAWIISRTELKKVPSTTDFIPDPDDGGSGTASQLIDEPVEDDEPPA